ncbi:hypothetical protein G6321_00027820 [Bradyrhizobium barranii subsp. barranii]|uniref:Phage tail collar domain-containing protein n=1 Tax=Bradyrhizobium barranii subsp. barranii TaxID=2823807 RepID=A0A7Z0QIT6_9BRAD|nr:hypothetical protein [Bradyrhizobium barranii]UGX98715.1 hypothetical protein G6321_00027820 [Bradyrhizobium barranii subsp. barranii]
MAGTIPLSLTQQFDEFGKPLSGALLYIIQAGTVSTPQQPYQDASLTILQPNPIQLDAAGRVPQFFLADGYIKVRLDDKFGVTQLARDGVLVIGPSAGGGGGGGVDPTTLIQTGAIQPFYATGVLAGFVRMNGRTIGSATSGASERANADCQALFNFLWNGDSTLPVAPSRGASSAADWAANKTIATPDFRGCAISGLDDMGNVPANRLTATYFGASGLTLGAFGGGESIALTIGQMPSHYHAAGIYDPTHGHPAFGAAVTQNTFQTGTAPNPCTYSPNQTIGIGAAATGVRVNSSNGIDTTYSAGGGAAFRTLGPRKLCTLYIKL